MIGKDRREAKRKKENSPNPEDIINMDSFSSDFIPWAFLMQIDLWKWNLLLLLL